MGRVEGNQAPVEQMVMELQKQLGHVPINLAVISPFHVQKREDYVPATKEVMEWMTDRRK